MERKVLWQNRNTRIPTDSVWNFIALHNWIHSFPPSRPSKGNDHLKGQLNTGSPEYVICFLKNKNPNLVVAAFVNILKALMVSVLIFTSSFSYKSFVLWICILELGYVLEKVKRLPSVVKEGCFYFFKGIANRQEMASPPPHPWSNWKKEWKGDILFSSLPRSKGLSVR